ncbi:MAG: substrate-binding domain-containing protein [Coriobacteriales bacterium]|jgi:sulfonate transport system substrate-binding protein|nr:substrate-binding domain-containing protein [Coriobacteriales bacterium]
MTDYNKEQQDNGLIGTTFSRRSFLRKAGLGVLGLAALGAGTALSACSSDADTPAATPGETGDTGSDLSKVTIRVGDIMGWDYLKTQLELGGLDDTPYTVEYTTFLGVNPAIEALAADQVDLVQSSAIPPLFASQANNGGNFKIVANTDTHYTISFDPISTEITQGVLAAPDSGVTKIAELKGRKVGFVKNTTAHYYLAKLLDQAGLSWDDIEPVELPLEDGASALLSNQVDAYAVYGMTYVSALNGGGIPIAAADDILAPGGHFYGNILASPTVIANPAKAEALADLLNRLNTAQYWCSTEGLVEWNKRAYENFGYTTEEDGLEYLSKSTVNIIPLNKDAQAFEKDVAKVFFDLGLFEKPIDVPALYDNTISDKLAELQD